MITAKYYTDLSIPIHNFYKVLDDNDFSCLIKEKGLIKPNPLKIWDDLFSLYLQESGSTEAKGMLTIMKRYYGLEARINIVNEVVLSLRQKHNAKLVEALRNLGFRYKYDPFSDNYTKNLNSTIVAAKKWALELEKLGEKLEKTRAKEGDGAKGNIEKSLIFLGKFMNRRIDPKNESIAELIEITKLYEASEKNGRG